jgi:opacity protein-like surface antigen
MKGSRIIALTAGVACLVSSQAFAQDTRWYATADVGLGALGSQTLTYDDGTNQSTAKADFSASFAGGGSVGYRFANGFALEGELMYRRNEMDAVSLPGLGDFDEGDFASLGFGINALYHFGIDSLPKLDAYAGLGFVYLQEIDIDFDNQGDQEISFETSDTAWQARIGATYNLTERWFVDGSLNYLTASGVRMEIPGEPSRTITSDYNHWMGSVGIGLRF